MSYVKGVDVRRIAFLADTHFACHPYVPEKFSKWYESNSSSISVNWRLMHQAQIFTEAVTNLVENHYCDAIVILGDIFHTNQPSVAELNYVLSTFQSLKNKYPNLIFSVILGNHDSSAHNAQHEKDVVSNSGYTPIDLLRFVGVEVNSHSAPVLFAKHVLLLPYSVVDHDASIPQLIEECSFPLHDVVIGMHSGIYTKDDPSFLRKAHDSVNVETLLQLQKKKKFIGVVAGNWHTHRQVAPNIFQVGSLSPLGWTNPGIDGYGKAVLFSIYSKQLTVVDAIPSSSYVKELRFVFSKNYTPEQLQEYSEKYHLCVKTEPNEVVTLPHAADVVTPAVSTGVSIQKKETAVINVLEVLAEYVNEIFAQHPVYTESFVRSVFSQAKLVLEQRGVPSEIHLPESFKILRVKLENFMSHDNFEVEFGTDGVTLLAGKNGAGKSAIIDAVAWALYGTTFRGSVPYRKKQKCRVEVETTLGTVVRERSASGRTQVHYAGLSSDSGKKGDELIAEVFPPLKIWAASSVLHPAASFIGLSDVAKKAIIENLLDLSTLDACEKSAKNFYSSFHSMWVRASADAEAIRSKLVDAINHKDNYESLVLDTTERAERVLGSPPTRGLLEDLSNRFSGVKAEINELKHFLSPLREEQQRIVQEAERLKQLIRQRPTEHRRCAVCNSVLDREKHQMLVAQAEEAEKQLDTCRDKYREVNAKIKNLQKRVEDLQAIATDLNTKIHVCQTSLQSLEQLEKRRQETEAQIQQLNKDLETANTEESNMQKNKDLWEAVSRVFSKRGFRVRLIQQVLDVLTHRTTHWARLLFDSDDISVVFSLEERKNGHVISVELRGFDHALGYKACSAGQRRRLDIASLLALAELFGARTGESSLFCDEVFDPLDESGRKAVLRVISQWAQTAPVVVVTHSPELVKGIDGNIVYVGR